MRITVRGKNMDVTDALRRYAEKKVEKLEKYFGNLTEAIITQSTQRNSHIVEVTLEGDGILLRGEERSDDMYSAIDQVVEKLEKQVKRFKGKLIGRSHPAESPKAHAAELAAEETPAEDMAPSIVRVKSFAMKPMTPEEASMQMELVNHDFYVFRNGNTEQINVIYKRADGDYGLIEPGA